MAVLIVVASTKEAQANLQKAFRRHGESTFLGKASSNVFIMKNNGYSLLLAWTEKKKRPFYVDIYVADELHEWELPDKVRRSVDWKLEVGQRRYPVSRETLQQEGLASLEELEGISLNS
jgi:hypothetical protein